MKPAKQIEPQTIGQLFGSRGFDPDHHSVFNCSPDELCLTRPDKCFFDLQDDTTGPEIPESEITWDVVG